MKVSGRNKENCLFHLPRSRSPLWWLSKHHQGPLCFWQGRHELVDLSYGLLIYKSFLNPLVIILKDCAWCPLEKKWKMLSTELLMKAALFPSPQLGNALPPADPRTRLLGQEDCWCTEQGTCQSSLWGWETIRVSSVGALRIMKWDVVRPWVCVCVHLHFMAVCRIAVLEETMFSKSFLYQHIYFSLLVRREWAGVRVIVFLFSSQKSELDGL